MRLDDPETNLTLLDALQESDPAKRNRAVDRFVAAYGPFIRRLCRLLGGRRGLQEDDIEDVYQDVLFKVVCNFSASTSYTRAKGPFRGWLASVIKHACLDRLRKESRARTGRVPLRAADLAELSAGTLDLPTERDYLVALEEVLASIQPRVSEEAWDMFSLTVFGGMSAQEVAAQLGTTVPKVHRSVYRVRSLLYEAISNWEDTAALGPTTPAEEDASAEDLLLSMESHLERVPGCSLLRLLGRGSVSVVCKARQHETGQLVAIKLMRTDLVHDDRARACFTREAEALRRLEHPNIIHLLGTGNLGQRPYLCLELAEGGNLTSKLPRYRKAPRAAARLVATLARAMHHAHQHGVVHCDLKPGNVLLTADDSPRVIDFGIAHIRDATPPAACGCEVMGTPAYMAPEQVRGESEVGPGVDVYALGAILYQLLTGQPPFRGPSPEAILRQVQEEAALPPSARQKNVPADLDAVCVRCLEKSPDRRYESAAALAAALEEYEASPAKPPANLSEYRLLGTREVADILGVSVNTVKRWVDAAVLPAYRTPGGHRKIRLGDILRMAETKGLPNVDLGKLSPAESPESAQGEESG